MKVGTDSRDKLKHKSTGKTSSNPNEKEIEFTMPSIPIAAAQNAQAVNGKTEVVKKLKSISSSVLLNRLDGPHNFYGVTMSREQQVKFMLREQARKDKKSG